MTTQKKSHSLGDSVDVKEGGAVVRPDGVEVTVTGGSYILTQTGTYDVAGSEIVVK
jgi:hypothetical protein